MADIYKYGTQELMPEGYKKLRDILGEMGYAQDQIGYNPQTKNPMLLGQELDRTKFIGGSDWHYYGRPDDVTGLLTSMGIQTPQMGMGQQQQNPPLNNWNWGPYGGQIEAVLKQIADRPAFEYDPDKDPAFQQASQQIQNTIMRDFARRNMLYSPATGKAVGEGIASVAPQYEQMQYERWLGEEESLYNKLNTLLTLDQTMYNRYKDAIANEHKQWEIERTERLDKLDEQYKLIDYAYKKLDELEYADNEVASILGIPVGTLSKDAKSRAAKLRNELTLQKQKEQYRLAQEERRLANEKALLDYKDELDQKKLAQEQALQYGTPEQQSNYKWLSDSLFFGDNYKDNPEAALQNMIMNRAIYEPALGPLYDTLKGQVEEMVDMLPEEKELTASEKQRQNESKLVAILDTFKDAKGRPNKKAQEEYLKKNKESIIKIFGLSKYESLLDSVMFD